MAISCKSRGDTVVWGLVVLEGEGDSIYGMLAGLLRIYFLWKVCVYIIKYVGQGIINLLFPFAEIVYV
jgi:hypothetical protein